MLIGKASSSSKGDLKDYCELIAKGKDYSTGIFWGVFGEQKVLEAEWKKFSHEIIDDPALRWKITH